MTVNFYGSETRRMPEDLTGLTFGRWIVRHFSGVQRGVTLWLCECECGREVVVRAAHLKNGASRSCGCVAAEKASKRMRTHGATAGKRSAEYLIWSAIKQRCLNPKHKRYSSYGGRGVSICERWRSDFANFFADMGPRPTDSHSVERKDNDGWYEPGNCVWATDQRQANNTRRNRYVVVRSERMTLAEAVRRFGGNYGTITSRLRLGQSIERALRIDEVA